MNYLFVFLFCCAMQHLEAQEPLSAEHVHAQTVIEVEVRLIDNTDSLQLPPYCGIMMTNMTLHYTVVKVVNGIYDEKTIAINHTCPRELIEFKGVENGKNYTYKLVPRRDKEYLLHDGKVIELPFSDYRIVR